ncbi:MAG: VWA domain-containing protein [Acidobacteria bacterium]|nr:VWA domain-containing protein [Acidobacteriota bacterium]
MCAPSLAAQADSNAPAATPADALRVSAGTQLSLELLDSIHTRHSQEGDHVHFTTLHDVQVGSQLVIPAGSSVRATLSKVKNPGRAGKAGRITLHFDEIILPDGTTLPLAASLVSAGGFAVSKDKSAPGVKGEGNTGKGDAIVVAIQAGQGALIGAAIGGKKGAAYGGAIGGGIGLAELLLRKGPHLSLAPGTLFEVELVRELFVPNDTVVRLAQLKRTPAPAASSPSPADSSFPDFPDSTDSSPDDSPAAPASSDSPTVGTESSETASAPADSIPDFPEDKEPVETASREPASTSLPPVALPPPPPPADGSEVYRMRVNVRLVLVEAFVRDARGRALDNLTGDDFRLWEDGVEQKIRHFSRDQLPMAVALVIDRSGSVIPYMNELRHAAYETLSQLKPGDQVALFAFDSDVEQLSPLTTNRRHIAEQISDIRAGGGTNILDALYEATHYLASAAPDRRRAIILISDNQATVRGAASQDIVIRQALEREVVIYSVKTPGEAIPWTMRLSGRLRGLGNVSKIAEDTGGEVIDVREQGSLRAALATVVARLKTRYTLGYQSTNHSADGAYRRIEVRLADRFGRAGADYTIHARSGYYAQPEQVASQPAPSR